MITNAPRSVRMFPVRDCVKDDGFPMLGQSAQAAHRTGAGFLGPKGLPTLPEPV